MSFRILVVLFVLGLAKSDVVFEASIYQVPDPSVLSECLGKWIAQSDTAHADDIGIAQLFTTRSDDIASIVVPVLTNTNASPLTKLFHDGTKKSNSQLQIMANLGASFYATERCTIHLPYFRHQCHLSLDTLHVAPLLLTALKQCCH